MNSIFKLYPWETMLDEEFAPHALETYQSTRWIEPIWKMLLSNKGILPILWQLYPNHELLLEAHFEASGASYTARLRPQTPALPRGRQHHPRPRQRHHRLHPRPLQRPRDLPGPRPRSRSSTSRYPVLGLWMIDQECCGMGIRESAGPITDNLSSFVPHFFT